MVTGLDIVELSIKPCFAGRKHNIFTGSAHRMDMAVWNYQVENFIDSVT
jgi:hypothetical protein